MDEIWIERFTASPSQAIAESLGKDAFHESWEKEGGGRIEELSEDKNPEIAMLIIKAYVEERWEWMGRFNKLLGVEQYFEAPLGPTPTGELIVYRGVMDKEVEDDLGEHGIDHKTTGKGSANGFWKTFTGSFAPNSQMEGYIWYMFKKYKRRATMFIDGILSHKTARKFITIPIDPSPDVIDGWLHTQRRWSLAIWEAEQMREKGMPLDYSYPKNTESCFICPFKAVCIFNADPEVDKGPPPGFRFGSPFDPDEEVKSVTFIDVDAAA